LVSKILDKKNLLKNKTINNAPDVPNEPAEPWQSTHAADVSAIPVEP
jgi:hypothetical protein